MEVDQGDVGPQGQIGTPLQLVNLAAPAINFKKRRMQGINRQDLVETEQIAEIIRPGEVMINDDFHAVEADFAGHLEHRLGRQIIKASCGEYQLH